MFASMKRKVGLATVAGVLGMAGSALAASPALAYHINFGTNGAGGAAPVGTTYQAQSSSIALTNSSGGAVARCTGTSLLGGATQAASGTSVSNQLNVSSGSFVGCTVVATGQPLTVTGNYSPAWVLNPTGGGPSPSTPFTGTISNVNVKITCGSNSETFAGTLSTGAQENNVAGASNVTLNNAQSLSLASSTGSGCGLPGPYGVTGVYTLSKINGAAITANTNLWLLQN